jgi:hypothetical protein
MKKRQPSLKSDSLRAAQAHAQTLAASAHSSDKDDDDGIYYKEECTLYKPHRGNFFPAFFG